jgi:sarcosine oxidase subunit beta
MRRAAHVVIIGGGCMGAATAFFLARRGLTDVVLLEREAQLGLGSTGRNAGGVRHQFSHESNVRLSLESIRFFERFEQEVGSPIDLHLHGYLFLLSTPAAFERFQRDAAMQRRLGVPVEVLSAEEAARLAPGVEVTGVVGATFCPRDGIADPHGVTMGFARAAERAGVEIARGTEATAIRLEGGKIAAVETTAGPIATEIVVNAAGPYAARVGAMVGLEVPVAPLRRHIVLAQPPAGARIPATRIMVIDFDTSFYFHREGANVLCGMADPAERPGFEVTVRWEFLGELLAVGARRLPALADAAIVRAWAGLYEMTPDAMPIIGPAPQVPGFYLITGFSGHGFQHSPAAGRLLADLIVGRQPSDIDLTPFAFERFARGTAERETAVV